MGDQWWWGVVGAAMVVGGMVARPASDRKWRSFVVEIVSLAGWMLVLLFVVKPLVPANVLGITILVVLVLCVLAVPLVARHKRRRGGSE